MVSILWSRAPKGLFPSIISGLIFVCHNITLMVVPVVKVKSGLTCVFLLSPNSAYEPVGFTGFDKEELLCNIHAFVI